MERRQIVHKLRLYRPHRGQIPIHASPARFKIATCGRRFGKTMMGENMLLDRLWQRPGSHGTWCSPIYKQAIRPFWEIVKNLRPAGLPADESVIADVSRSLLTIRLKNESWIEFRSADNPDTMRGMSNDMVVIDEAAQVSEATWTDVLRPTLSDRQGHALVIGTPRGRDWFYRLWQRGQDPEFPLYESWQLPTSLNPFIPSEDLVEAKSSLASDTFLQEYEAQFLEDGSGVFRNLAACTQGMLQLPIEGHTYVIGYDLARFRDWTVMVVIDVLTGQVVHFERMQGVDYVPQLALLGDLCRRYFNAKIWMDSTHGSVGDPLLEIVRRQGLPVTGYPFTGNSKLALIEHLKLVIDQTGVTWPAELKVLRHELEVFEREVTEAGNIKYQAPENEHDDCVCALAMAVWGMRHGSGLTAYYRELLAATAAETPERASPSSIVALR